MFKIKVKEDDDKKGKKSIFFHLSFVLLLHNKSWVFIDVYEHFNGERNELHFFIYKYYSKQHRLLSFLVFFFLYWNFVSTCVCKSVRSQIIHRQPIDFRVYTKKTTKTLRKSNTQKQTHRPFKWHILVGKFIGFFYAFSKF